MRFSSVQSLSHVWLFVTPWAVACQTSLSITNSWSAPKPMSIESVMPSNHLTLGRPLLLVPSIFPSIRVFSNESALHIGWPKYWSFSFNISPSSEHPGLISFMMNWLDLLAVQETLKSLLYEVVLLTFQSYFSEFSSMIMILHIQFSFFFGKKNLYHFIIIYSYYYKHTSKIFQVQFQMTIKWVLQESESHEFFDFPVHVKVTYTVHYSLLHTYIQYIYSLLSVW